MHSANFSIKFRAQAEIFEGRFYVALNTIKTQDIIKLKKLHEAKFVRCVMLYCFKILNIYKTFPFNLLKFFCLKIRTLSLLELRQYQRMDCDVCHLSDFR